VQVPLLQEYPGVQTCPHEPQLLTSELSLKQEVPQRLYPVLQAYWHREFEQVVEPFVGATQRLPQDPQLFTSEENAEGGSHANPQAVNPEPQVKPHCELVHVAAVAFGGTGHALPQDPQFFGSLP